MTSVWNLVRCRLQLHRWQPVDPSGQEGWACRDCDAAIAASEYVERVYDDAPPEAVGMKHGFGVGAPPV